MSINTLGTTPKTVVTHTEDHSINKGFVAKASLERGAVVKLAADGEVEAIAAATDKPLGVVVAGTDDNQVVNRVTVQTYFSTIMRCKLGGAITVGADVTATGIDTTGKITTVAASAADQYILGVALEDGAAGDTVLVGVNRNLTTA